MWYSFLRISSIDLLNNCCYEIIDLAGENCDSFFKLSPVEPREYLLFLVRISGVWFWYCLSFEKVHFKKIYTFEAEAKTVVHNVLEILPSKLRVFSIL